MSTVKTIELSRGKIYRGTISKQKPVKIQFIN